VSETRVFEAADGEDLVVLVFLTDPPCDGRTDGQTDRQTDRIVMAKKHESE